MLDRIFSQPATLRKTALALEEHKNYHWRNQWIRLPQSLLLSMPLPLPSLLHFILDHPSARILNATVPRQHSVLPSYLTVLLYQCNNTVPLHGSGAVWTSRLPCLSCRLSDLDLESPQQTGSTGAEPKRREPPDCRIVRKRPGSKQASQHAK